MHHAAGRVAAEQRALRAAQNLDTRDIVEFAHALSHDVQHNVIHYHAYRLRSVGLIGERAQAADLRCALLPGLEPIEYEARHHPGELADALHVGLLQKLPRPGGDGDRHVLHGLLAAARSDDDLLET